MTVYDTGSVLGAGVSLALPLVLQAAPSLSTDVAFTASGIWVMGVLLSALAGAIGVLFKQLQSSHDKELTARDRECKALRERAEASENLTAAALIVERTSRVAEMEDSRKLMRSVEAVLTNLNDVISEQTVILRQLRENGTQEHALMLSGLQGLDREITERATA